MSFSRDDFFNPSIACKSETVTLKLPSANGGESEGTVVVRQMTARERTRYETSLFDEHGNRGDQGRERLLIATVYDESGSPLFTEADVEALAALPATLLDPLIAKARDLNFAPSPTVEDLAKNSVTTPPVA